MKNAPDDITSELSDLNQKGDATSASALVLRTHGPEIMAFLLGRSHDAQLASEAFSAFSEDVVKGLPGFSFRSTTRTWVYAIAHHALARTRGRLGRQRSVEVNLVDTDGEGGFVARDRSETPPYLKTGPKERLLALRERLPEADTLLLDMRVGRRFSWKDIAKVFLGPERNDDDAAVAKEAARLRKRFQLATATLREMARAEGILDRD